MTAEKSLKQRKRSIMANKNVNTKAQENTTATTPTTTTTPTLPVIKVTKEYGIGKVNAGIKEWAFNVLQKAFSAERGEENVRMVRTGNSSQVNELAIKCAIIDKDGFEHEACITLNPTVKAIEEKVTKNGTIEPFDFESAVEEYENYMQEQTEKTAKKEKEKAEKIAKDKARREKAKAEKEAKAKEKTE
jgi:hypothetical protein